MNKRLLLSGAIVAALSATALIAQQQRNISGLVGRTDSNLNLYVRSAASGSQGQASNIGGLVGRTDANLNLYVTFDSTVTQAMGSATFADGTALLPSAGVGPSHPLSAPDGVRAVRSRPCE